MSKKFEVGMIIQAFDRATGPVRGISAAIRKMSLQAEKDTAKASKASQAHMGKAAKAHGGGIGSMLGEGIGKIGAFLPEIAGITLGVGAVVEGYKKLTAATDEAEAAQLKLSNAMMHNKGETKASVDAVADLAGALQEKTPVDDETLKAGAAQLAMFRMNARQIRAMLPVLDDYIVSTKGTQATQEDAVAAAKLLGKAWTGNTGALRKQGIVLTAAQEAIVKHGTVAQKTAVIIRAIQSRMGGLGEKIGATAEGMKKRWEQQLNEVQEKAGAALLPLRTGALKIANQALPYLSKLADAIPGILTKGTGMFKAGWGKVFSWVSEGFKGANTGKLVSSFKSWGPLLMKIFKPIIPVVRSVTGFIYKAVGQIGKWLVDLWNNSQPGLKALAEAFKPVIDVIRNLWFKVLKPLWDSVLEPLLGWLVGSFVPFLVNVLGPTIKWIVTQVAGVVNWVIDFVAGIGKAFSDALPWWEDLWGKIQVGYQVFAGALKDAWHKTWEPLFQWVEKRFGELLKIFEKVGVFGTFITNGPAGVIASEMKTSPLVRDRSITETLDKAYGTRGGTTSEKPVRVEVHVHDRTQGGIKAKVSKDDFWGQVYRGLPATG